MSVLIQYDFFKSREECEKEAWEEEFSRLKESTEKVRKAMFARHGELYKKQQELEERIFYIEKGLCQKKEHDLLNLN